MQKNACGGGKTYSYSTLLNIDNKKLLLRIDYSFLPQNRWWFKCSLSFGYQFFAELYFQVQHSQFWP